MAQLPTFMSLPTKPHMCFIQIGENDLLRCDVNKLTTDILSFASYLHEGVGIPIVIVGQFSPPALGFLKGLQCENCRDQSSP